MKKVITFIILSIGAWSITNSFGQHFTTVLCPTHVNCINVDHDFGCQTLPPWGIYSITGHITGGNYLFHQANAKEVLGIQGFCHYSRPGSTGKITLKYAGNLLKQGPNWHSKDQNNYECHSLNVNDCPFTHFPNR